MSFTITTDIFCDGDCGGWETESSISSNKPERSACLKTAKRHGWKVINGKHYCLGCAKEKE